MFIRFGIGSVMMYLHFEQALQNFIMNRFEIFGIIPQNLTLLFDYLRGSILSPFNHIRTGGTKNALRTEGASFLPFPAFKNYCSCMPAIDWLLISEKSGTALIPDPVGSVCGTTGLPPFFSKISILVTFVEKNVFKWKNYRIC